MPKLSKAKPKANSRIDDLMPPLSQKWGTVASNLCAGFAGFGVGVDFIKSGSGMKKPDTVTKEHHRLQKSA